MLGQPTTITADFQLIRNSVNGRMLKKSRKVAQARGRNNLFLELMLQGDRQRGR